MTFANLYANQDARNFGLFSYTVVCFSAFYYIFVWKRPILILGIEKYLIGRTQFLRGKTSVSLKILKMVQQP